MDEWETKKMMKMGKFDGLINDCDIGRKSQGGNPSFSPHRHVECHP